MKFVFVDFDDTLCLHSGIIDTEKYLFTRPCRVAKQAYSKSRLNSTLVYYLQKLKKDGYTVILLTSACSKILSADKSWCAKYCPKLFDDFISSGEDISKIEILKAYKKRYKIKGKDDIILIDDKCFIRKMAEKEGFKTFSPQYLQNYILL